LLSPLSIFAFFLLAGFFLPQACLLAGLLFPFSGFSGLALGFFALLDFA
jgi:hypothetical protein